MPGSRLVLFVCSGNYYRSRFAELVFNHRAGRGATAWLADSAGLMPEHFASNPGSLSSLVVDAATTRGIVIPTPHRQPKPLTSELLERATSVVALNEPEHRPLFQTRFPPWVDRVIYWKFPDVDLARHEVILPAIEDAVAKFYEEIAG